MTGKVRVAAGLPGDNSALLADMAAAGGENTGIFLRVAEMLLHGFPKCLAYLFVCNLERDIIFYIITGIFLGKDEHVFIIVQLSYQGFSRALGRRAHIGFSVLAADVFFTETAQSDIARDKPPFGFAALLET